MFAVAEDGELAPDRHERLQAPALLEVTERLKGMLGDIRRVLAETRDSIRTQLDEVGFTEAWEQGKNLTADEAVALALDSVGEQTASARNRG